MKKIGFIIVGLLLSAMSAFAQYTTVSGTIKDPSGVPYANGLLHADFKNGTGCGQPLLGGTQQFQMSATAGLDSTGAFSGLRLVDNNQVGCATSKWTFSACNSPGLICFSADITITGGSQSITTEMQAAATALPGTLAATFTSLQSNPATTGVIRLATGDLVAWRNAANSANVTLGDAGAAAAGTGNVADLLIHAAGFQGGAFVDTSAAPAQAGVLRTGNNTTAVAARNAAGNGNLSLLGSNASDQAVLSTLAATTSAVSFTSPAFISSTANPSATGIVRLANTDAIIARNAANNADISLWSLNASNQVATAAPILAAASTATLASLNIPAGTAPTAAVVGDVWYDSTTKAYTVSPVVASNPQRLPGVLAVLPPQAAITTVTTIQVLNGTTAITIPAGAINVVGKHVRIKGMFVFSNGADTPALTVTLKFGAVTLAAPVSAANANNNSSSPAFFDFDVTTSTTGATGTVEAHGRLMENVASGTAGAAMATYPDTVTAASGAIDLTGAITATINLTVGGGTVTTATLRQTTVEILN